MTDVMAMVASSGNKTLVKQKMEEVLDLETNITKVFYIYELLLFILWSFLLSSLFAL